MRLHLAWFRNRGVHINVHIYTARWDILWGTFMLPLLQWKSNKYYILSVCVCSLRYPPCNVHAPYCRPWHARLYIIFPQLSHKRDDFRNPPKKVIVCKICFHFLHKFCLQNFIILSRIQGELSLMYIGLRIKYPLFLLGFNKTWIFSTDFRKTLKNKISWKSTQWEKSFFFSVRAQDMKILTDAFRNFFKGA